MGKTNGLTKLTNVKQHLPLTCNTQAKKADDKQTLNQEPGRWGISKNLSAGNSWASSKVGSSAEWVC
jgi:hypothetical protein